MLLQRTLSILVLGLVLAACSFQPTTPTQQPNDDLSPQFTGWQLMGGGAKRNCCG